ncbi:sarcosine oxidase subunit gamma [Aestuariivirga litoralis]|uniref:sarcosine oxidase subunit gamma n=1 Tax=Aestuariivirga litoralis TaxID=2650924 RepID=UPI0018C60636|nr:sarcosine oxidase subunit gamma family protein [Aestuariivirga litoralis]MBG1232255.1 hypothetical protein [Aestuariivirga litoralis]
MLEATSPLGKEARFEIEGLTLSEGTKLQLTQYAATQRILERELDVKLEFGTAQSSGGRTVLQVSEDQVWSIGPVVDSKSLYVTPLSSGRTRIVLEGDKARALLFACAPVDFSPSVFSTGHYVMTGIHHTPVTIHCVKPNTFHIYVMRTFALSMWEWLTDAAEGL